MVLFKNSGYGTILNDEEQATPSVVSVTDLSVDEDAGNASFTVSLDQTPTGTVSVDYATSDGTATAGADYTRTAGELTWESGDGSSRTVTVPITDDDAVEEDERFTLTLSNVLHGTFAGSATTTSATATIIDDDEETAEPAIRVGDASAEEGESLSFTVSLSEPGSSEVSVEYETASGTATEDTDYDGTSGTLTFAAGDTSKTVIVSTTEDADDESDETFTLTLSNPSNATLGTATGTGTITDDDEPLPPLTATFRKMPDEHDGSSLFWFEVLFSEEIPVSYTVLRDDDAFTVTGGEVRKARRVDGRHDLREIHIEPTGTGTISITLPPTTNCNARGAICMGADDGRKLSQGDSDTVAGPVGISIADATAGETQGPLEFTVSLSRARSAALRVDYATSDGTATAGADYDSTSGTLEIGAGATSGTIEVAILDDDHNEVSETLTVTLSNPTSGVLTDETATGTITNHDPLPQALLARFGRAVAVEVVDQVEQRIEARRTPGWQGRFAGRQINAGDGEQLAASLLAGFAPMGAYAGMGGAGGGTAPYAGTGPQRGGLGGGSLGTAHPGGAAGGAHLQPMNGHGATAHTGLHPAESFGNRVLEGSAFELTREQGDGTLSFWSRTASSSFRGRERSLSLGGDVRTSLVGADYQRGRVIVGLSVGRSSGLGDYQGSDSGRLSTSLTGLYPWIGVKLSERLTVWSVGGHGSGSMLLTPGAGASLASRLAMGMAAAGARTTVAAGSSGFRLDVESDALWVRTRSDGVTTADGRLGAASATVTRYRTGIEGSHSYTVGRRLRLQPSVEAGLRHDGGDAENGAGIDMGAGLVLADAASGLAIDIRVRTLVVHQADGFSERGVSVALSYDPTPATPLGLNARVSPGWGGETTGGAGELWARNHMGGLGHHTTSRGSRLDGEIGYGLPVGSQLVGTPRVAFSSSEYGRDYRIGYAMSPAERGTLRFELGVDTQIRHNPLEGNHDKGVAGQASISW